MCAVDAQQTSEKLRVMDGIVSGDIYVRYSPGRALTFGFPLSASSGGGPNPPATGAGAAVLPPSAEAASMFAWASASVGVTVAGW